MWLTAVVVFCCLPRDKVFEVNY